MWIVYVRGAYGLVGRWIKKVQKLMLTGFYFSYQIDITRTANRLESSTVVLVVNYPCMEALMLIVGSDGSSVFLEQGVGGAVCFVRGVCDTGDAGTHSHRALQCGGQEVHVLYHLQAESIAGWDAIQATRD